MNASVRMNGGKAARGDSTTGNLIDGVGFTAVATYVSLCPTVSQCLPLSPIVSQCLPLIRLYQWYITFTSQLKSNLLCLLTCSPCDSVTLSGPFTRYGGQDPNIDPAAAVAADFDPFAVNAPSQQTQDGDAGAAGGGVGGGVGGGGGGGRGAGGNSIMTDLHNRNEVGDLPVPLMEQQAVRFQVKTQVKIV